MKNNYSLYDNESLPILKIETFYSNSEFKNISYKVFNPLNLSQELNLEYCTNMDIEIRLPIKFNYYENNLIEAAKKYGYNIFDENDPFYNDVCSKFQYGSKDISLSERHNLLNLTGKKLSLPGCNYSSTDLDTYKGIYKCKNHNNGFIDNYLYKYNPKKDEDDDFISALNKYIDYYSPNDIKYKDKVDELYLVLKKILIFRNILILILLKYLNVLKTLLLKKILVLL